MPRTQSARRRTSHHQAIAAAEQSGLHGTARTRSISLLEFVALLLIAALLIIGAYATSGRGPDRVSMTVVRVGAGDTLWTVAQQHPVVGMSTAQTADLIARANAVEGGLIHPGDTLLAPKGPKAQAVASR